MVAATVNAILITVEKICQRGCMEIWADFELF